MTNQEKYYEDLVHEHQKLKEQYAQVQDNFHTLLQFRFTELVDSYNFYESFYKRHIGEQRELGMK